MKIIKASLYIFGICAVVFTIFSILNFIELSHQHNIIWWSIILMWPLDLFGSLGFLFSNPGNFFHLPLPLFIRNIVAVSSPFLALTVAKRFGYSQALWFILALIFPFILLLIALRPPKVNISPTEKNRIVKTSVQRLVLSIIIITVGFLPSNENVVYLIGARWIASDNHFFATLFSLVFLMSGFVLCAVGILVALGIKNAD